MNNKLFLQAASEIEIGNFLTFRTLNVVLILIQVVSVISFSQSTGGTISDIDGNTYKTVILGEQKWMQENLRTTTFNNGNDIPQLKDSEWARTSSPAYSWYDNDRKSFEVFGALYNWHSIETGNLCPSGWIVPSDEDWATLIEFSGGSEIAGKKLKIEDTFHVNSTDSDVTDEYGFSALLGGYRYGHYWSAAEFIDMGINGYWWTSTEYTDTHAWSRTVQSENSLIYRSYFEKNDGFSVRCIKNP